MEMIILAGGGILAPDWGLLFWMSTIFVIFWIGMYMMAGPAIKDALNLRNTEIQDALDEAEKARAEMQNLRAENDKMIAAAKEERTKILAEAKTAKETIIEEAKVKAKEEADKILASANQEIENQKKRAITEVKNESGLVALAIAENVVKRQLTENADQEGLMDKLIDEIKFN